MTSRGQSRSRVSASSNLFNTSVGVAFYISDGRRRTVRSGKRGTHARACRRRRRSLHTSRKWMRNTKSTATGRDSWRERRHDRRPRRTRLDAPSPRSGIPRRRPEPASRTRGVRDTVGRCCACWRRKWRRGWGRLHWQWPCRLAQTTATSTTRGSVSCSGEGDPGLRGGAMAGVWRRRTAVAKGGTSQV